MSFLAGPSLYSRYSTVAEMLSSRLAEAGDRVALTADGLHFTYGEIDSKSRAVAATLQSRGLGRGSRIGLCLHRDPSLLTAMLGVIRSGAAYVPLDPSFPPDRLAFMMSDARLDLLISNETLASACGWSAAVCPLIDVAELEAIPAWNSTPTLNAQPEDAIYLLYTSGSTGTPKGVVVPHRAVVNFLESMAIRPGVSPSDSVLAITTLSFDISVLELLLPWSVGARVVLARSDQAIDGVWLSDTIAREGVSILQATPGTWRILLGTGWRGSPNLRALIGGEPLPQDLAAELVGKCCEVWNMYGPTETTVWSTCWKVTSPLENGISLGDPIANTLVLILDPNLEAVPADAAGEICIGGAGLAHGYFRQPELTAAKFVLIRAAGTPPQRFYRTGDMGRLRLDGALVHMGRLDDQIKIRGYRIEPGEIESRLVSHPGVSQALVTARQITTGGSMLVAYVVPMGSMPEPSELRRFLREWVPDYMVPQAFVRIDSIPLLPNGKTDRRSLPAPELGSDPKYLLEPQTPTQAALQQIWRDVLGVVSVGINDSFFDLGGDSLLAVRAIEKIQARFGRRCPLPVFFGNATIAQLASFLDGQNVAEESQALALQSVGDQPPIFCVCGIHLYQHVAEKLTPYGAPVLGAFVPSELSYLMPDGARRNHRSIPRLAAEYVRLILAQRSEGPYRVAGFSFGGVVAFEIAQQLRRAGKEVDFLALLDSDVPNIRRHNLRTWIGRQILRWRQLVSRKLRQLRRSEANSSNAHIKAREAAIQGAMHRYAAEVYDGTAVYIEAAEAEHDRAGYDWTSLITDLRVYRLPGDHTDLLSPSGAARVAEILGAHLTRQPVTRR